MNTQKIKSSFKVTRMTSNLAQNRKQNIYLVPKTGM